MFDFQVLTQNIYEQTGHWTFLNIIELHAVCKIDFHRDSITFTAQQTK